MEDGSIYPCHILGGVADYLVCTLESREIAKRGAEQPHLFPGLNGVLGPNARLIAAAPELLQALQKLLDLQVAKEELKYLDKGIGTKTPNAAWLEARSAVAKARGEQ
ncbi:hypothetical protein ACOTCW_29260 [Achromobacter xylosoxidans]